MTHPLLQQILDDWQRPPRLIPFVALCAWCGCLMSIRMDLANELSGSFELTDGICDDCRLAEQEPDAPLGAFGEGVRG